jgi:hypothetical protein
MSNVVPFPRANLVRRFVTPVSTRRSLPMTTMLALIFSAALCAGLMEARSRLRMRKMMRARVLRLIEERV